MGGVGVSAKDFWNYFLFFSLAMLERFSMVQGTCKFSIILANGCPKSEVFKNRRCLNLGKNEKVKID